MIDSMILFQKLNISIYRGCKWMRLRMPRRSCRIKRHQWEIYYPQRLPFLENDFEIRQSLCFFNPIPHSFTIIRKSTLQKVEGYSTKFTIVHDYDLWVRLLEEGKGHNLDEVLGVYRVHETSFTSKKERTMIKEAFQVQWKAYRKLGGSFWKIFRSLFKRGVIWFLPEEVRSYLRTLKNKR